MIADASGSPRPFHDEERGAMRWPTFIAISLILISFQIVFSQFVSIGGVRPDLLFLSVLYTALAPNHQKDILPKCAFAGFLNDLFSNGPFGLYLLLFPAAAGLLLLLREYLLRETIVADFAFAFSASLVVNLACGFVQLGFHITSPMTTIKHAGAVALYTALVAIVSFRVLKKLRTTTSTLKLS